MTSKPRKKKMKVYTIHCPVEEIWVIEVEASSPRDAMRALRDGRAQQMHSFSGTTKSGASEIVQVRDIEPEKKQK